MKHTVKGLAVAVVLSAAPALAVKVGDTVYIQSKDTALLKTASATASTLTKLQPGTEVVWQGTDATNKQFHKVKAGAKEGFVLQSNIKPNKPLVEVASDGKPTTMSALASSGAATHAFRSRSEASRQRRRLDQDR